MKKAAAILFLIAVAAGVAATRSYFRGEWRFNHPGLAAYPIQGIDVSHHQGNVDWRRIPRDRYRFVYMKATEGGDFKDSSFAGFWRGAGRAGLTRGAYHFFTFRAPGALQAKNFLAALPADGMALPPAVDFEFAGNAKERPSKEWVQRQLFDFLTAVEKTTRRTPVIYATHASYNAYLRNRPTRYPVWIRDLFRTPVLSQTDKAMVWQYANNGVVPGVPGRVDLDVFMGSAAEFDVWTRPPPAPSAARNMDSPAKSPRKKKRTH